MSARVQFVLSDEEYEEVKAKAAKEGVSISKYAKDRVLEKSEGERFKAIWDEFCAKLDKFPAEIEFDVSTIMGQERWVTFDKSTKLSIAKQFNKKVNGESEGFCNITMVGRSPSNVSKYKKN